MDCLPEDFVYNLVQLIKLGRISKGLGIVEGLGQANPCDADILETVEKALAAFPRTARDAEVPVDLAMRRELLQAIQFEAMADDGVGYRPLVWSAWGRPHPGAAAAIPVAARRRLVAEQLAEAKRRRREDLRTAQAAWAGIGTAAPPPAFSGLPDAHQDGARAVHILAPSAFACPVGRMLRRAAKELFALGG